MPEKLPKDAILQILEQLADRYNMKLVKRDVGIVIPELPEEAYKYVDMDSKELSAALRNTDINLRNLQGQEADVKEAIIKFMNENKPDECKQVFSGNRFESHKLEIFNKKLILTSNLRNFIATLLQSALENELTEKFIAMNPQFKDIVKSIKVEQKAPLGNRLMVNLSGKAKQINTETDVAESNKGRKGATTTKSFDIGGNE